ncbi:hypothetical protein GCK72_020380 [Caenorhabditis remanei]|uniref:T20D4.11-like domain-containing protein n=1 Tax=Caenorhabditis remanei TaxID=31234 RepID=A0A6A5GGM0_CAERE|nr:hypothetical protein GCK72_020380 [Caenorhabditis remanei]KAF1753823.1 hypothetical protein GCK72_020380 [Caenorhabditis remanei]
MKWSNIFWIAAKSTIVLIPLLFIIRLAIINFGFETMDPCRPDSNLEKCAMKHIDFNGNYRNWESANFPSNNVQLTDKLKTECTLIPKCFQPSPSDCKLPLPSPEHFQIWCRRIYFFSGEFSKCAGKVKEFKWSLKSIDMLQISQISGSSPCANEFFSILFFEKPQAEKCGIMKNNKKCILESVTKTCTKTMADVLEKVKMKYFILTVLTYTSMIESAPTKPGCTEDKVEKLGVCVKDLTSTVQKISVWAEKDFKFSDIEKKEFREKCEGTQNCFKSVRTSCTDFPEEVTNELDVLCSRFNFIIDKFTECVPKLENLKCVNEVFGPKSLKKTTDEKCQDLKEHKDCAVGEVEKTCGEKFKEIFEEVRVFFLDLK